MKARRYNVMVAFALLAAPAFAQETYQDTKLVNNELNGTARYVGMGGAMEALGADISTIATNPAGIGLFRSSQVTISGGLVSQGDANLNPVYMATDYPVGVNIKGNKTNASFDQVGLVYSMRNGRSSFFNFGFSYHKSRNFDQILTAVGRLDNASQNKLTAAKFTDAKAGQYTFVQNKVDANYLATGLGSYLNDDASKELLDVSYYNGSAFAFGQYQKGYIGNYSFNLSGNINNRVYLGATFGLYDVNYHSNSIYSENLEQGVTADSWEQLNIDGTGFDIKVGAIFRPIESSPFRIGLYVHTPTWYDLRLSGANDISLIKTDQQGKIANQADRGLTSDYDFKLYTPWKFGVSLGHTVGSYLALGATYEYADYSAMDNRVNDGGYYDAWTDYYYESSSSDEAMNAHTKATLKGVSTLKLGAEYKLDNGFAVRVGYNYVSPMFQTDGYRDGTIGSYGVTAATSTDYTNWKSTNRLTCGVGYTTKKFFADLAYQYAQTNGEFFPFMSYVDTKKPELSNVADHFDVSHKRHQLLLTLGYRF